MELKTNSKYKRAFITIPEKARRVIIGGMVVVTIFSGFVKILIDRHVTSTAIKNKQEVVVPNVESERGTIKIGGKEFTIGQTEKTNNTVNIGNSIGEAVTADTVVQIPDKFKSVIAFDVGKDSSSDITIGDLEKLEKFGSVINPGDDLSWLNYCKNLKEVKFSVFSKDVDFSQIHSLPSLENFSVLTSNIVETEFSESNFGFLHDCPNLHKLTLYNLGVEPGFVESLTQLKELNLSIPRDISVCIDFSKLTHLDKIVFPDDLEYEIPIYFTENDYNTLVNAGVTITNNSGNLDINKILEIGRQLDQMVASLGLTDQSTDQEKLDAILVYVLENYSYDQEVSALSSSGEDYGPLSDTFYVGGDLYGVFNKGGNIICGNYSALVEALARRVGLDAHSIVSQTHAWNIINIEGENYIVDATWLDGQSAYTLSEPDENGEMHFVDTPASEKIKSGNGESLHWYMEKPSDVQAIDENNSHSPIIMPPHISLESKEDGAKLDVTPIESPSPEKETNETKKFSIKFGTKEYIIGGSALVGILGGLGLALHIPKKDKKKKTNLQRSSSLDSPSLGETSSSSGKEWGTDDDLVPSRKSSPEKGGWGSLPEEGGWGSSPEKGGWGSLPEEGGWGSYGGSSSGDNTPSIYYPGRQNGDDYSSPFGGPSNWGSNDPFDPDPFDNSTGGHHK